MKKENKKTTHKNADGSVKKDEKIFLDAKTVIFSGKSFIKREDLEKLD